jgi:uncharacterized Rmd1/YagE family protein
VLRPTHERRTLLQHFDEASQIGGFSEALDNQVNVVRHKAVRENGKLFRISGTLNLLTDSLDMPR